MIIKQSVTVAYINYQKAFDTVWCHNKLFIKLKADGITGNLLLWIMNFLSALSQVSRIGSALSTEKNLVIGIVQGSCIGPLLFLIYINDIIECLPSDCKCTLFANDLKVYSVANVADGSV